MLATAATFARSSSGSPQDLPSLVLLVAAIAGIPVGIYLFYRGFSLLERKRLIQNIPLSTIRGAAIGPVELSGMASGPYTILSPLSQRDCYYYTAEAHILRRDGDRYGSGRHVVENLSVPFFLTDSTGSVMVDARGANTDLPCTFDELVTTASEDDCVRHFIARRGLPETGVRLVEHCIVDGDPLFVLGTLSDNSPNHTNNATPGNEPGFLSAEAGDLQRREILEYMHVTVPGRAEIKNTHPESTSECDLCPPVVLRKGMSGKPFFISRRSQRDLVEELAGRSFLYIWGGPLLAVACLLYLLARAS